MQASGNSMTKQTEVPRNKWKCHETAESARKQRKHQDKEGSTYLGTEGNAGKHPQRDKWVQEVDEERGNKWKQTDK